MFMTFGLHTLTIATTTTIIMVVRVALRLFMVLAIVIVLDSYMFLHGIVQGEAIYHDPYYIFYYSDYFDCHYYLYYLVPAADV